MNTIRIRSQELKVTCDQCQQKVYIEDVLQVLDKTFVCHPDLYPECLGEWNNENSFPSQLDTYFHD